MTEDARSYNYATLEFHLPSTQQKKNTKIVNLPNISNGVYGQSNDWLLTKNQIFRHTKHNDKNIQSLNQGSLQSHIPVQSLPDF